MAASVPFRCLRAFLFFFLVFPVLSHASMFLLDRLQNARSGDYIVTAIDNHYTVLIVKDKSDREISIEEITVPLARLKHPSNQFQGWRTWVEDGACGNTSWAVFSVDCQTGRMTSYYSFSNNGWYDQGNVDSFLSKLLTLKMARIPKKDAKRIGPAPAAGARDIRQAWSPQMVYEGNVVPGVDFEAWRTSWPKDNSELSGKVITAYVPADAARYPSYFPYWLEIQGMVGKAKVRIIDSGRNLHSLSRPPSQGSFSPSF